MTVPNHKWRKFKDVLLQVITFTCAVLVITPLILVFYHLIHLGFSSINLDFFTKLPKAAGETGGGMGNAIVGTFVLICEAVVVGVPIGVLGGVYLSEYGGSKTNWWIRFAADILNGVPSIAWGVVVYGLMVVALTAPFRGEIKSVDTAHQQVTVTNSKGSKIFKVKSTTRLNVDGQHQLDTLQPGTKVMVWYRTILGTHIADRVSPVSLWNLLLYALIRLHNSVSGFSALAGGVALGLMMIPLVIRTTEEVLQLVPSGYREAALALGIAKWRTTVQIVIRTALKGIITGVLLAVARIAGETAPLLFTIGASRYWNFIHLTRPISAIPVQIYVYATSPYPDWHRQAWAGALVLLLLVLAINIGVRFFTRDRFGQKS